MAILLTVMTSDTRANQFCLGHKLSQNLPSKSSVYSRVGKVSFSRQLLIWFIECQLLYPIASERVLRKILFGKGSFFSPNEFLHDKEREILVGYSLHEQISS